MFRRVGVVARRLGGMSVGQRTMVTVNVDKAGVALLTFNNPEKVRKFQRHGAPIPNGNVTQLS